MPADLHLTDTPATDAVPITPLTKADLEAWLKSQAGHVAAWVKATGFKAKPDTHCLLPGDDGGLGRVLAGVRDEARLWALAGLPRALPEGDYALDGDRPAVGQAALGWALGAYAFDRYKTKKPTVARLCWPEQADKAAVTRAAEAAYLVRDLVNTPAGDMGPAELAGAAEELAAGHGARVSVIAGDALLEQNYPAVHAVGRASARAPRLIDMTWGDAAASKVTLVGKGVCFDSGGLGLKSADGMQSMKKDMGGAAHALALARMIMDAKLPVRLRVIVPAVENSIAGNAYRPLDVIKTRSGVTVEIGHTDAEGRVILADALTEAVSEEPALLIDFATLTGAARTALGPELPALFADDDDLAAGLVRHGGTEEDPVWRLPLWPGYRGLIDGRTADITNSPETGFAGAITAALFLREFVGTKVKWAHLDIMAWNTENRPGRPRGGEAMGLRAAFALIAERFGGGG